MTNITMGLEKTEQDIFAFEVADEALEIAAGPAKESELHPRGSHRPVCVPG